MKIKFVSRTENPIDVIAKGAGTSYGKEDASEKRVISCFKSGHMGVFEHACLTVRIEGISRACSHQLVRHRLASFVQQSQRYCRIDVDSDDWYVKPKVFDGIDHRVIDEPEWFDCMMRDAARAYNEALEFGIKPEDARYLLPEATKTNITMTVNVRELYHFLDMRTDKAAQWEIRWLSTRGPKSG